VAERDWEERGAKLGGEKRNTKSPADRSEESQCWWREYAIKGGAEGAGAAMKGEERRPVGKRKRTAPGGIRKRPFKQFRGNCPRSSEKNRIGGKHSAG